MTYIRLIFVLLALVIVAPVQAAMPVIKTIFVLDSPTFRANLKRAGVDYAVKTLSAELATQAENVLGFVDWSADAAQPVATMTLTLQQVGGPPANYYLHYTVGGTNPGIGRAEPLFRAGASDTPTHNVGQLIARVAQQIKTDFEAARQDLVRNWLKTIVLVQSPPKPAPVIDSGLLNLPVAWDELRADGDVTKLKIEFVAQPPQQEKGNGRIELIALTPCDDVHRLSGEIRVFKFKGEDRVIDQHASLLAPPQLQTYKVYMLEYTPRPLGTDASGTTPTP